MLKTHSIKVYGKVQGVGFRFYTQKTAVEMGVKGYVKNERDGSVYIEAEAPADIIESFLHWVSEGPEWARVDEMNVQDIPTQGFADFSIR
ncbi:MAG: acylphosphatase [Bacteroidales bacterium]|jgi:acylphosphatase|nr:acylphosphatase [Bacteroidales bacterium]